MRHADNKMVWYGGTTDCPPPPTSAITWHTQDARTPMQSTLMRVCVCACAREKDSESTRRLYYSSHLRAGVFFSRWYFSTKHDVITSPKTRTSPHWHERVQGFSSASSESCFFFSYGAFVHVWRPHESSSCSHVSRIILCSRTTAIVRIWSVLFVHTLLYYTYTHTHSKSLDDLKTLTIRKNPNFFSRP